jgi:hypothetical protein
MAFSLYCSCVLGISWEAMQNRIWAMDRLHKEGVAKLCIAPSSHANYTKLVFHPFLNCRFIIRSIFRVYLKNGWVFTRYNYRNEGSQYQILVVYNGGWLSPKP